MLTALSCRQNPDPLHIIISLQYSHSSLLWVCIVYRVINHYDDSYSLHWYCRLSPRLKM